MEMLAKFLNLHSRKPEFLRTVFSAAFRRQSTSAQINPLLDPYDPAEPRSAADPISLYQPFVDRSKPIPVYAPVNLRLRGYDYVILEHFQHYVHSMVVTLGIKVAESWPSAAHTSKTVVYKPRTTAVDSEYNLAVCERTIQLEELQTTTAHVLLEILHANLPIGVELSVKYPDAEDDSNRYLPDLQLQEKQEELHLLLNPKKSKKDMVIESVVSTITKDADTKKADTRKADTKKK